MVEQLGEGHRGTRSLPGPIVAGAEHFWGHSAAAAIHLGLSVYFEIADRPRTYPRWDSSFFPWWHPLPPPRSLARGLCTRRCGCTFDNSDDTFTQASWLRRYGDKCLEQAQRSNAAQHAHRFGQFGLLFAITFG